MSYCHKCGHKNKPEAGFCGSCGSKLKERTNGKSSSKSPVKAILLFIILLFIVYLCLNFWAMSRIQIDNSMNSILNTVSNTGYRTSLSSTEIETEITVRNPTIIPILATQISYDVTYDDNVLGKGATGFIFIMPNSETTTPANFEIDHSEVGGALIDSISNLFQQKSAQLKLNIYAGIGFIRIPIGVVQ